MSLGATYTNYVTDPARPVGKLSARDDRAKIIHWLLGHPDRTARQIQAGTGVAMPTVQRIVKALRATGQFEISGGVSSHTRYRAIRHAKNSRQKAEQSFVSNAQRMTDAVRIVGTRERIRKAIAAEPGRLNVESLAERFGIHEADARDAVDRLLQLGEIIRDGAGFRRSVNGRLP